MKIAIDLMGGEGSGNQNLEACLAYPEPCELVLIGDLCQLDQSSLDELRAKGVQCIPCSSFLSGQESPRALLTDPRQNSLSVALNLLADEYVDAVVSSADTKAIMVLGRSRVGCMQTLRRPAIAKAFQGPKGQFYMLDLGANVRCSPALLQQFARLGSALHNVHKSVSEVGVPRVALLNIGVETGKGTSDVNAALNLIADDARLNCIGFLEPNDLFSGIADVVVCDGYAGNLVLKTIESMATYLRTQLAQLPSDESAFHNLAARIDPDRYNGALFAGLSGVVVKSHGSASVRGFLSAMLQGRDYAQAKLPQICQQLLQG